LGDDNEQRLPVAPGSPDGQRISSVPHQEEDANAADDRPAYDAFNFKTGRVVRRPGEESPGAADVETKDDGQNQASQPLCDALVIHVGPPSHH
jgi:hypothetical protein